MVSVPAEEMIFTAVCKREGRGIILLFVLLNNMQYAEGKVVVSYCCMFYTDHLFIVQASYREHQHNSTPGDEILFNKSVEILLAYPVRTLQSVVDNPLPQIRLGY